MFANGLGFWPWRAGSVWYPSSNKPCWKEHPVLREMRGASLVSRKRISNPIPTSISLFYGRWSSVAQHLPDAPVDRDDDDEAGCVAGDSPLSLVGWGSGAESVTVSGPPRVMPHINRQEWYEQYLLHRAARKGHPAPASKRTFVRVYMRHWKNT